jgi:hypothetical protein
MAYGRSQEKVAGDSRGGRLKRVMLERYANFKKIFIDGSKHIGVRTFDLIRV